jgi:hypothetical protein
MMIGVEEVVNFDHVEQNVTIVNDQVMKGTSNDTEPAE